MHKSLKIKYYTFGKKIRLLIFNSKLLLIQESIFVLTFASNIIRAEFYVKITKLGIKI